MPDSQVVIVTGAAGNLGQALCKVLSQQGCRVVAVDRKAPGATAHLPAAPALAVGPADLTDPAACTDIVAQAVNALGRVNGLVHTVGGFMMATIAEGTPKSWEEMWRLNVLTTANIIRACWPAFEKAGGGSVVAIGAQPALRAGAGMAAYAGAKAAVLRLIEAASEEGKPHRIRANAVLPSIIDTPQNRAAMPGAETAKWVTPKQVAEAIAFLLSDAASGVTGAELAVTGRV